MDATRRDRDPRAEKERDFRHRAGCSCGMCSLTRYYRRMDRRDWRRKKERAAA